MQLKQHVSTEFLHQSGSGQTSAGGFIIEKLTLNAATFPHPPIPVATLSTTNASYSTLISQAKSGDHNLIQQRNNAAKLWKEQFKATADYVDGLADGDAQIITAAGMMPTKAETAPRQVPADPVNAQCHPTAQAGGIELSLRADKNVDAYLYVAAPEGVTVNAVGDGVLMLSMGAEKVYIKCDTHASVLLAGLESHKPLYISMQPVNNAGAGQMLTGMQVTPQ